jgi:hypothetical protein
VMAEIRIRISFAEQEIKALDTEKCPFIGA